MKENALIGKVPVAGGCLAGARDNKKATWLRRGGRETVVLERLVVTRTCVALWAMLRSDSVSKAWEAIGMPLAYPCHGQICVSQKSMATC